MGHCSYFNPIIGDYTGLILLIYHNLRAKISCFFVITVLLAMEDWFVDDIRVYGGQER